jgi:hypothetical protein
MKRSSWKWTNEDKGLAVSSVIRRDVNLRSSAGIFYILHSTLNTGMTSLKYRRRLEKV